MQNFCKPAAAPAGKIPLTFGLFFRSLIYPCNTSQFVPLSDRKVLHLRTFCPHRQGRRFYALKRYDSERPADMICRPLAVSARTGKTAPASSVKGAQPQHQKLPQPLFEHPHPQVTEAELSWPHPQEHPHDEEPEHPQPQPQEESLLGAVRVTVPVQPRPSVMVSTLAPLHPQPEEEEPQPPQLLQAIG